MREVSRNKRVLITGGTGLVGKSLWGILKKEGFEVAILSRSKRKASCQSFIWDIEAGYLDPKAIEFADVIIHLAGENISSGRWTKKQKQKIVDSRIDSGRLLFDAVQKSNVRPSKLISASAIGYYGAVSSKKVFEENDSAGNDFLASTVSKWEQSIDPFIELGLSVSKLRVGIVLSKEGGALQKMANPVKMGVGSPLGSGKQWMPWISMEDLCRIFLFLIENDFQNEVFNAVAPQHISNADFMKTIAKVLNKALFIPNIPAFALKIALGEMADIVLEGSRISSDKIIRAGFSFKDQNLYQVLQKILA